MRRVNRATPPRAEGLGPFTTSLWDGQIDSSPYAALVARAASAPLPFCDDVEAACGPPAPRPLRRVRVPQPPPARPRPPTAAETAINIILGPAKDDVFKVVRAVATRRLGRAAGVTSLVAATAMVLPRL